MKVSAQAEPCTDDALPTPDPTPDADLQLAAQKAATDQAEARAAELAAELERTRAALAAVRRELDDERAARRRLLGYDRVAYCLQEIVDTQRAQLDALCRRRLAALVRRTAHSLRRGTR